MTKKMTAKNYKAPTESILRASAKKRYEAILHFIIRQEACDRGLAFFRKHRSFESAWYACPRVAWATWLSDQIDHFVSAYEPGTGMFGATKEQGQNAMMLGARGIQPEWAKVFGEDLAHAVVNEQWGHSKTIDELLTQIAKLDDPWRADSRKYGVLERMEAFQRGRALRFTSMADEVPEQRDAYLVKEDAVIAKGFMQGFDSSAVERMVLEYMIAHPNDEEDTW